MSVLFASQDDESLDSVLHGIGDAVCVTDRDMVFMAANKHFANFYGMDDPNLLLGKSALEVYPGFRQSVFYEACARTAQTGETTTRYGFSANIRRWVVIRCYKFRENRFAMVVHQLSDATTKAGYVPQYDTLTSLPNRWAFEHDADILHDHLQQVGLMLVDISHFREINETLGFPAGDRCLMEVAARIRMAAHQSDRVYRLGNDQFLVLGAGTPSDMGQRRDRILRELDAPLTLAGKEYVLAFNVGACVTTPTMAGAKLLTHAEQALSFAKTNKLGYAEYSADMGKSVYSPELNKEIRDAIENDELVVMFQPQLDLIGDTICSAEALVRWKHPDRGMVPPSDFLPFAEETGLIVSLDRAVATKTMEQIVRLAERGMALPISFNLSALSVSDYSTVQYLAEQVEKTGVDPEMVGIEITETSLMRDVETSQKVVEELKKMGMHISIDDFGSGYSSMAYLLRYPSNFLKIDRDFIRDLHLGGTNETMIANLIGLAHGMGIGVVAEGVETQEDQDKLRMLGCDMIQGYHLAKPMPGADLEEWLTKKPIASLDSVIR